MIQELRSFVISLSLFPGKKMQPFSDFCISSNRIKKYPNEF